MLSKTQDLVRTYSGIFGNQVILKGCRGKIIMTIRPPRRKPVPTENQVKSRQRFLLASRHAQEILKDPEILAAYKARLRKGQSPYNLALKDCLKASKIANITTK